jgi:peptidoglycan/LPS O-acetylase OafA/YrhL
MIVNKRKFDNYSQISILKGICICFVMIIHSHQADKRLFPFYPLLFRLAVPIFIFIIGFNMRLSYEKNKTNSLKELYSFQYFKKKFKRFVIPFIFIFSISIIIILILGINIFDSLISLNHSFLYIIVQSIILLPLIIYYYEKNPKLTLKYCISINLIFFIICRILRILRILRNEFENFFIFSYLILILLGVYLAKSLINERKIFKSKFLIIGFIIGFLFIFLSIYLPISYTSIIFYKILGLGYSTISIIGIFYLLGFLLLCLKYFSNNPKNVISKFIEYIGKASYHIFILQTTWFIVFRFFLKSDMIRFNSYDLESIFRMILFNFFSLVFCILLGSLFYEFDKKYLSQLIKL